MIEPFVIENRYQVQSIIGEGGNAVVYLGLDTILKKEVAIKLLKSPFKKILIIINDIYVRSKQLVPLLLEKLSKFSMLVFTKIGLLS